MCVCYQQDRSTEQVRKDDNGDTSWQVITNESEASERHSRTRHRTSQLLSFSLNVCVHFTCTALTLDLQSKSSRLFMKALNSLSRYYTAGPESIRLSFSAFHYCMNCSSGAGGRVALLMTLLQTLKCLAGPKRGAQTLRLDASNWSFRVCFVIITSRRWRE